MKLTHCHTIITPTNPTNSSVHSNLSTCTSSNGIENFNNVSNYESQSKVTSLCYSADNTKLAIATADRAISIYNNQGERVDKFNTKANSNGPKDYIIRSIQFGPDVDNPKLAIAQSDAIVFVYKWKRREGTHSGVPCTNTYTHVDGNRDSENGGEMNASIITATNNPARSSNAWNGKKSICNKFIEESAVTSLIWPRKHPHQIVYGLLEGKVKIGNLRSNKSKTLYNIDSNVVVSLTSNLDGTELLSGHTDGSIYRFVFPTKTKSSSCTKIIHYSSPPSVLSWGRSICVSGMNDKVVFYNDHGDEEQTFSYNDQDGKIGPSALDVFRSSDFTTSCCSPNGDSIVVGSFDCFYLYCWNVSKRSWEENITHAIQHMYSVTAIDWKSDGTSLVLGTSSGLVDKYDAAYRQFVYKDSFVITYVSPSQVLICDKDEANSRPVLIQSSRGEITKLKIYHEPGTSIYRYIVARTKKSLLLYDIESFDDSVTEISWRSNEKLKEKFIFDASNACIISNAGELSVVEVRSNISSSKSYLIPKNYQE
jgi:intraflagellar transport protein 172